MPKILITAGPVHAFLDPVKIITNKFKGGLMAAMARNFLREYDDVQITYLTAKGIDLPDVPYGLQESLWGDRLKIVRHNGFDEYRQLVLELGSQMDGVILGAAVANLIPLEPFKEKFPSHKYKPGDRIDIPFTIAPRVIDELGRKLSRKTHLFGFKLLTGTTHEDLIRAAYGVVLESGATAVFANDAKNLDEKFVVTKERTELPMDIVEIPAFVMQILNDEYYSTEFDTDGVVWNADVLDKTEAKLTRQVHGIKDKFKTVEEGYIFGTVAVRAPDGGFMTTARGKHELFKYTYVHRVDHDNHRIWIRHYPYRATLNAPLLDWIFRNNPNVDAIVHYHEQNNVISSPEPLPYAPPGTVRDSQRQGIQRSFNIVGHGCFILLDNTGKVL